MSIGISVENRGFPRIWPPAGVKVSVRPPLWAPSGQINAHTPIAPSAFGRPLDSLTNLMVHGTPTPYTFCTEGVEYGAFCRIRRFQGILPRKFPVYWRFHAITSYRATR